MKDVSTLRQAVRGDSRLLPIQKDEEIPMRAPAFLRQCIRYCIYLNGLCITLALFTGATHQLPFLIPFQAFLFGSFIFVSSRNPHHTMNDDSLVSRWLFRQSHPFQRRVVYFALVAVLLLGFAGGLRWGVPIYLVVLLILALVFFAPSLGHAKEWSRRVRRTPLIVVDHTYDQGYIPPLPSKARHVPESNVFPQQEMPQGTFDQYEEPHASYPPAKDLTQNEY